MTEFDKHGDYGPMVATQREAVIHASRAGAAIFFVGPDQIYSAGAFGFMIGRLSHGYRAVIGPGLRIKRDEARRLVSERIRESADGSFALTPAEQHELLFRCWHPINDQFVMGSGKDIWWKAYVYYRPTPDELFIRFFQGPTLAAWPKEPLEDFDGFIDHTLAKRCCRTPEEVYVVRDGSECLALDMTDDARNDVHELACFPRADLLRQFFTRGAINEIQLRYGMQTCRVHRVEHDESLVGRWMREMSDAIDPVIALALWERKLTDRLGRGTGRVFRTLAVLNLSAFCTVIRGLRLARPARRVDSAAGEPVH
jgi:hypothetical protein